MHGAARFGIGVLCCIALMAMDNGVLAPAGAPRSVVERLNKAIAESAAMPLLRERLLGALLEPATDTTTEFRAMLEGEAARWSKLVKDANVRAD